MAYKSLARRLKFLGQSLRRHGPGHVIEVFRQAAVRSRYASAPPSAPTLEQLASELGATDARSLVEHVARGASRRLPMALAQRKEFTVSLIERSQGYDAILEDAERFGDGRFLALGISTLEPDGAYDWHRDYGSARIWEHAPYNRVRFVGGDGSDVKFPWELSRCYWIAWLGKAYWITSNGAWSREFVRQIDAWTEANPVNVGVNWAMPMEVGIRAFWWSMGFGLFHGAPNIDEGWWSRYLQTLWAHGVYLESNLEYFSNLTNHYIANCFGLVAVGSLFADTARGRRWLDEGRQRLAREIAHQVLPDGVHYERSLPYHKLVLEMYLIAAILLDRATRAFDQTTLDALERMSSLHCDVTLADGTTPQIGDADDGVILRMTQDANPYDARTVAAIAAVMFGRADFARCAGELTQGAIMMTGGAGFETFRSLQSRNTSLPSHPGSRLFADGGFAVLRTDALHVVADCGPIGLHGNNDTLSFVLSDARGPIVIDPGTYCYTRSERLRNELRSTRAHNAPAIDAAEIARFDGLWRVVADRTKPEVHAWSALPAHLIAGHSGYEDRGVAITREWSIVGDRELRVVDGIDGSSQHEVSVRFTLAPDVTASMSDDLGILLRRDGVAIASVRIDRPASIRRVWYSPSYGVAAMTDAIEIDATARLPMRISYIWTLVPIE